MAIGTNQSVVDIARAYIQVLRDRGVKFESAWLFGSTARTGLTDDSDIDIAVFMRGVEGRFLKEVELTRYRRELDLRIEPHVLDLDKPETPFAVEILRTGLRIA